MTDITPDNRIPNVRFGRRTDGTVRFLGLTDRQAAERAARGEQNTSEEGSSRTLKDIFAANILTFFNLINVILFVLVLSVHSWKNMLFILVAIINTGIGIFHEIRAKRALDRLRLLSISHVTVIRGGRKKILPVSELVKDDVILLKSGEQIPADGVVLDGSADVNESLLTGEQDAIHKERGKKILSGSFLTAGSLTCVLTAVGRNCYMQKLGHEARKYTRVPSELQKNLNRILKLISIVIVPIGVLLFLKQMMISRMPYQEAVLNTVAAVLGMIPEGLVLLTSIALAIGTVRLASRKTLVRDIYCIETLARVDTLCLDKTGTLTEGKLRVSKLEELRENAGIERMLCRMTACLGEQNSTFEAVRERFPASTKQGLKRVIPFSSDRKYSGIVLEGEGTWLIGAYSFLVKPGSNPQLEEKLADYSEKGYRVLTVAHSDQELADEHPVDLPFEVLGIVLLSDVIRREASQILDYFKEQNVDIRIISGDDPVTVSAIAARAGLEGADQYVDASSLADDTALADAMQKYKVFGRVTPRQKQKMVAALKQQGRTVAMTGDGVNDVLALKEADCGIAMASGSEAAKNIANIVLLDSDFSSMPHIVNEGRRVINNIKAASSMFLIKTGFSAIMSLFTMFLSAGYPFRPVQLSVINGCAVGLPTMLLQFEPRFEQVKKGFFAEVLRFSLPASAAISLFVLLIQNMGGWVSCTPLMCGTVCVLLTGWIYMQTLTRVYSPLSLYRKIVIGTMQVLSLLIMALGRNILELGDLNFPGVLLLLAAISFTPAAVRAFEMLYDRGMVLFRSKTMEKNKTKLRRIVHDEETVEGSRTSISPDALAGTGAGRSERAGYLRKRILRNESFHR